MCKKFLINRPKKESNNGVKVPGFCKKIKLWNSLLLFLIAVFGVGYLGLVNYKATVGFKIGDLERKVEELKENRQKMELDKVELQKISRIQEAAKKINMVRAPQAEYLKTGSDGLALR